MGKIPGNSTRNLWYEELWKMTGNITGFEDIQAGPFLWFMALCVYSKHKLPPTRDLDGSQYQHPGI
jgi:hypothetical protein